ncbi:hypothetical protein AB0D40_11355 [Streptomyces massasporeus]|uniref:hypothetical protein n=1 Tax=Streptomyces massasporeus TaxID=67324 RepID=UPI0033C2D8D6
MSPHTPFAPIPRVDDFPVMWAAPGTLARTAPWQLDPDRRPQGNTTDRVLTSRRLLFLGTRTGTLGKADVLAEYPRESLAAARRMRFSEVEADVRLSFADGSWIRLFTGNPDSARAWRSSSKAPPTPWPRATSPPVGATA